MHKLILGLISLILLSCQSSQGHQIVFERVKYETSLEKVEKVLKIKGDFFNKPIELKLEEDSDRGYISEQYEYSFDVKSPAIEGPISTVIVTPYYGRFALGVISGVRNEGRAIQAEICPIESKYLMIVIFYHQRLPYVGCIIEKKENF